MKGTSQRPLALIDFDGGVDLTHEPERSGEADGAAEEKEPRAEHEHVAEVDDVGVEVPELLDVAVAGSEVVFVEPELVSAVFTHSDSTDTHPTETRESLAK